MRASVNEIWELIDNLTLGKKLLYKRMQNEINENL